MISPSKAAREVMRKIQERVERDMLRAFGVPEDLVKNAHDIKITGAGVKFKTKCRINMGDWRGCYGSVKE